MFCSLHGEVEERGRARLEAKTQVDFTMEIPGRRKNAIRRIFRETIIIKLALDGELEQIQRIAGGRQ